MTADSGLDATERSLLTTAVRRTMTDHTGAALAAALTELGWPEILTAAPELAGPVFFRLLGETGAHAPLLLDVFDPAGADAVTLPFAGERWVRWDRDEADAPAVGTPASSIHRTDLPVQAVPTGSTPPARVLADGRRLLGWWLLGSGHAMLTLARTHAIQRAQFGRPLASFQAVRHRLAETLVALDGAEAALLVADAQHGGTATASTDNHVIAALLAKAAAGQAALTAARHCQQVLGGIGFTAEHAMHRHLRRVLILDGLLGSTRELTQQAGATIRRSGTAIRIAQL
ncbi:acyl-CoA dehydrogenase family protein [Nocardia sp. NPDC058480]|uniref:acyl-CoA dehydrogenase family protein n=1 Tax=Nocardia sp. NPDC058480 TaxID=3346522 RepID=UPI00366A0A7A